MEYETLCTGVCSRCCEIDIGTKNSCMISWKIIFFKHEKSRMENFYLCCY